ncbi:MAG: type II toxin-antitoxin system RelE/ParE family toxin [Chloroflexaceae bacterium]|nr:type II toxin-antitoxin system RelE/ParE family toxin [Chloroflexaceae bacterium]
MKVIITPEAEQDMANAVAFLLERTSDAANRLVNLFEAAEERLADFPALGRVGRVAGTREMVIADTHYVMA